ncbi:MocR-like pyridoxine biosynthesis transcription factor PdxR [Rhizobium sp. GR12]|uniref:MocR-like pyridoxine biosynthesis transcription factor PdxR n=1 Tax=Rhizobium sp. GR12 TaxID=3053925 RepID=UPI002FBE778F
MTKTRPILGAKRIYQTLKEQITDGVFGDGGSLPSSRSLAEELGVSRTTVTAAYEQLQAEGFVEVRQGMRPRITRTAGTAPPVIPRNSASVAPLTLSSYGERIQTCVPWSAGPSRPLIADFRHGNLSGDDFPTAAWNRAMLGVLRSRTATLTYADPRGSQRLRMALQGYLWRARMIRCDLDQIIVVNGSQQGLDLCARLLLDEGDRFVIEDPCYEMAAHVFSSSGAEAAPVRVDAAGMDTDRLAGIDARLAYVTPSHQFPLGGVMPVARRYQLLEWAQFSGTYIIEDDYDSEFRYDISPVPPLYALEDNVCVIYCGTISKTLSPGLRLGYLVVPAGMSDVFAKAKMLMDRHTPAPQQEALAELIENGTYEAHIRRIRRRNRERRETLLNAIIRRFGDRVAIEGADAGLHLVVWLKGVPLDKEPKILERATQMGIGLYPISALYCSRSPSLPDCVGLVMGYSALDVRSIERGIHILWDAVCGV